MHSFDLFTWNLLIYGFFKLFGLLLKVNYLIWFIRLIRIMTFSVHIVKLFNFSRVFAVLRDLIIDTNFTAIVILLVLEVLLNPVVSLNLSLGHEVMVVESSSFSSIC